MAVNYATAAKTARMTATRDHFADGTLEVGTAGMGTVLVSFGLSATGGTVSGDTWTVIVDATTIAAVATGTAAEARLVTNGSSADLTGLTVGTSGSGANVVISSTTVTSGQNVTYTSGTIQHAA